MWISVLYNLTWEKLQSVSFGIDDVLMLISIALIVIGIALLVGGDECD